MIVVCGNCQTRFQLDDARVPESGIRVRCSRCKEAFFLQNPSASQAEVADAIAAEAAEHEGAPPPGMTQDLPGAEAHDGAGPLGEDEESDWEFNDADFGSQDCDESSTYADSAVAPSPDAFEAGSGPEADADAAGDVSEDFDSLQGRAPVAESAAPPQSAASEARAAAEDDDPFGAVDDFSSLADPEDDPAKAAPPPAAAARSVMQDGDLEDPEDWDFFSEESLAATQQGPPEAVVQPVAPEDSPQASTAMGGDSFDLPAAPSTSNPGADAVARAGRWVGWGVTLCLLTAGVVNGLLLESPLLAAGPDVVALGALEARGIEGRWMDRANGATVFVVGGELHNPGAKASVPSAALRIALRSDGGGDSLASAVAGRRTPERHLRELGSAELQVMQHQAAAALSWSPIPAGGSVPFAAVFEAVPVEAMRFELEVAPAGPRPARRAPVAAPRPELASPLAAPAG